MGCCGDRRAAQRAADLGMRRSVLLATSASPQPPTAAASTVAVRYLGNESARVRGPVTGRPYLFDRARPVALVHPGDADVMLRGPAFQLARQPPP